MRIVVVLPAPLGPTKPVMRPAGMLRSALSTARRRPYVLVSQVVRMAQRVSPSMRAGDRPRDLVPAVDTAMVFASPLR